MEVMPDFRVSSAYRPTGDQPRAVETLAEGIKAGEQFETLLGATGTGKTATMAWLIEQVQRPTLVIAHNKTLAAQLCNEFREFLPENAVEYFVSYYDCSSTRSSRSSFPTTRSSISSATTTTTGRTRSSTSSRTTTTTSRKPTCPS